MVADALIEIIGGLILLILGWLGLHVRAMSGRMDTLDKKIQTLDDNKVDNAVYQELRGDIHKILDELVSLKLEQARWQGRAESLDKNRQEKY